MTGETAQASFHTAPLTSRGIVAVSLGCVAAGVGVAFAGPLNAFAAALAVLLLIPLVWVLKSPARALCVYGFVLPLDVYLSTTLRVTSTQALQVLIFTGWMAQILFTRSEYRRGARGALPYRLGIAFLAYLVVSLSWSVSMETSARMVTRTIGALLMAVYAAEHADGDTIRRITRAMCYGAVVTAGYGFAQYARGGYDALYPYFSPFFTDLWTSRGGGFAVVSTFANPNILAGYVLIVMPLAWAHLADVSGARRLLWTGISGALAVLLLLTFSKASWLLLAVLAGLWALFRLPAGLSLTIGAGSGVALGVGLLLFEPIVRTLVFLFPGSREASVDTRLSLWWAAVQVLLDRPIFGWGMDGFAAATAGMRYGVLADLVRAHNMYLQALVDLGIAGSVLLWGTCLLILREAWHSLRAEPYPPASALHLGLLLGSGAFFLYGLVETLNVSNQYVNTSWFVLGLLAASSRNLAIDAGRMR